MNAIRIRLLDLESDTADEVAEVIATALEGKPRAEVERVQHAVLDTLEGVAKPAAPVEVIKASAALPPAVAASSPFAEWFDIPEQHRAWNAIGTICHYAPDPEHPTATICNHDIGMLRDPSREIQNDARPCAACNRSIERLNRRDNA